jgi:zinc transport system substrate-binding protein
MPHQHLFLRTIKATTFCFITSIFLFITSINSFAGSAEAKQSKNIVVTIKPLYSLVAHLTEGITQPVLLLKNLSNPHHYNVRPSERRLLAKANIIIWLGPELEPQLNKMIQQHDNDTADQPMVISAKQAKNLTLLNRRSRHSHEENHFESAGNKHLTTLDPHIWLSAHNAEQISQYISERLIAQDPKNTRRYQSNLRLLLNKIEQTKKAVKTTINDNKQPFIALHDAFQYFEHEYGLNYIDSISNDLETGTSLKHMQQIKDQINKKQILCLVYQPPRSSIIDTITKQTTIKATELDPLGRHISNDMNAWFEIMQNMSINFSSCLNP